MRFTETITVYNKIPQQGRESEKLRRTVVHGAFWDYTTGAAFGKSGKDDSDSIMVMIPGYACSCAGSRNGSGAAAPKISSRFPLAT